MSGSGIHFLSGDRKCIFLALFNPGYEFGQNLFEILSLFRSSKIEFPDLDPLLVKTPYLRIPCNYFVIAVKQKSHKSFMRSFRSKMRRYADIIWDYELRDSVSKFFKEYVNHGIIISPIQHKNTPDDSDINAWHQDQEIKDPYIYHEEKLLQDFKEGTTLLIYSNKTCSKKVLRFKEIKIGGLRFKVEGWKHFKKRVDHLEDSDPSPSPSPVRQPSILSGWKRKKEAVSSQKGQKKPFVNIQNPLKYGLKAQELNQPASEKRLDGNDQHQKYSEEKKKSNFQHFLKPRNYFEANLNTGTEKRYIFPPRDPRASQKLGTVNLEKKEEKTQINPNSSIFPSRLSNNLIKPSFKPLNMIDKIRHQKAASNSFRKMDFPVSQNRAPQTAKITRRATLRPKFQSEQPDPAIYQRFSTKYTKKPRLN